MLIFFFLSEALKPTEYPGWHVYPGNSSKTVSGEHRDIPQQIIKVNINLKSGQAMMEKSTFSAFFFFFPNPH